MLTLYNVPISTCSQKVRLCLAEKEIDWHDERMDFSTMDQLKPEYLKLNPNGVVPTLVHDNRSIIDSSVICEYLDEVFPEQGTSLIPIDPYERAQMRAWLRYIEEVPTASIRYPSFAKLFKPILTASMSEAGLSQYAARLPLRKHFYKDMMKEDFAEKVMAAEERLQQCLVRVDQAVTDQPWIAGQNITLADLCILPTIIRLEDLQMNGMWKSLSHFSDWLARIKSRPSYETAFYPEAHVSLN